VLCTISVRAGLNLRLFAHLILRAILTKNAIDTKNNNL
jgi:hypothetical protein